MKNIKKNNISKILALVVMALVLLPLQAHAVSCEKEIECKENQQRTNIEGDKFEVSKLSVGEKVSHEVQLSNGEKGWITIEKIAEFPVDNEDDISLQGWSHWHTRNNVTDGSYKVNVVAGVVSAGFTVDVRRYNITAAYDPWHKAAYSNVSGTLTLDSSKKATYFMNFNMSLPWVGGQSWTGGVQARIEGKNLVTYWD